MSDERYKLTGEVRKFEDYERVQALLRDVEQSRGTLFGRVEIWPTGQDPMGQPTIVVTAGSASEEQLAEALGPLIEHALNQMLKAWMAGLRGLLAEPTEDAASTDTEDT